MLPVGPHDQTPADVGSASICVSIINVYAFTGGAALGRRGSAWDLMSAHHPAALCSADVVGSAHGSASRAIQQGVIMYAVSACFTDDSLETSLVGGVSLGCSNMSLLVASVDWLRRDTGVVLAIDDWSMRPASAPSCKSGLAGASSILTRNVSTAEVVSARRPTCIYHAEITSFMFMTPVAREADKSSQFQCMMQGDPVVADRCFLCFTYNRSDVLYGIDCFSVMSDHMWDIAQEARNVLLQSCCVSGTWC